MLLEAAQHLPLLLPPHNLHPPSQLALVQVESRFLAFLSPRTWSSEVVPELGGGLAIDETSVPLELRRVPHRHWFVYEIRRLEMALLCRSEKSLPSLLDMIAYSSDFPTFAPSSC